MKNDTALHMARACAKAGVPVPLDITIECCAHGITYDADLSSALSTDNSPTLDDHDFMDFTKDVLGICDFED